MRDHFHLKEYDTSVSKEVVAGLTTFFSMAYILIVAPSILSESGIEWGAVFLASIIASVAGTLVMSLYANVPFVLAPGLGMCSFFLVTVCGQMGFTWQQGLSVVFICGLINILITITNLRRMIVASIPKGLQYAISGGIGIFIAYIGIVDVGFITFINGTPGLASVLDPSIFLFLLGIFISLFLYIKKVTGGIVISILVISLLGIPLGVTSSSDSVTLMEAFSQIPETFGVIFTSEGLPSLFTDSSLISTLIVILSFSLVDTFDTIGTFVGTGRSSGIFSDEDLSSDSPVRGSRLDRALVADACGTSVGAVMGTSNVTTVVESATGISVGGRTGLASLVSALCILASMFMAGLISMIPAAAYSAVLVLVGMVMLSSFKEIDWSEITEAAPAFFTGIFMALCYNISYGIAMGFIVYCVVKLVTGGRKEVERSTWTIAVLFILMFLLQAIL